MPRSKSHLKKIGPPSRRSKKRKIKLRTREARAKHRQIGNREPFSEF